MQSVGSALNHPDLVVEPFDEAQGTGHLRPLLKTQALLLGHARSS